MGYYVEEYRDGHIGVEQLVMALFELLNTHAKVKIKEACISLRKERKRSKENQFSFCRNLYSCTVCVCDCCELCIEVSEPF